jgi:hypothetical protein
MIKVNLQPKVLIESGEGFKMPLWPLILLTIVLAAGVLGVMYVTSDRISAAEAEIRDLDFKLRDFQKTLDAFEQAKSEKDYLQGKRDRPLFFAGFVGFIGRTPAAAVSVCRKSTAFPLSA